jgi:hypothetical protein
MDPNEALRNARAAMKRLREEDERDEDHPAEDATDELTNAFEALDGWLTKGDFLPADWRVHVTSVVDHETSVIDAVRTWVNADCGAPEADAVIAALAAFDDAVYTADEAKKKALALVDDAAKKTT